MNPTVILFTVLATTTTLAKPNGYYHQEYNYQTSSSSYKNHELQHRNDDEGYYSKDGDLEGRFRPRINAHSQHSEYVNPKLQHGYRIGTDRTSSFGQLHAQNRFQFGEPGMGGPEMGVAYPVMGVAQNYGVSSNLREVTTRLEHEMQMELQRAVEEQHRRAMAYGESITQAQIEQDRRILEEELRRNITMRIQDALKAHYGNQGIRGGYSYSIMNGRLQPTANYNNQELLDLTRQLETNLLRHLDQQVQTTYHTRVDTQVHTTRNTYRVNGVNNYPGQIVQRPVVYPYQPPQPYPPQPHPVPAIPDSITTVATRVQTELNEILNKILEDTQRRYFSDNTFHSGVNYDAILAQLQDELRANITFHFDDQIKRAYGYSNYIAKYSVEDIENLRRQIENNLITKLNRDFNRQRERFFQTHHAYMTVRPIPANHIYYPVNNMNYQAELAAVQRQLQEQMSRQLQTALMEQSYRQAHMYTDSNFNPEIHYQATLQRLSAELNRNLTHQMESLNTRHLHAAQLDSMRNQLQHDLMRQLQQGLQQSFSRYSSWHSSSSASSSSSANYRPTRGFDQNVYNMMGEDCMMGDDPSTSTRKKRSPPNYQSQTPHVDDSVQTIEDPSGQIIDDSDLTQVPQQPFFLPNQRDIPPEQRYKPQIEQIPQGQIIDDSDIVQRPTPLIYVFPYAQRPQLPAPINEPTYSRRTLNPTYSTFNPQTQTPIVPNTGYVPQTYQSPSPRYVSSYEWYPQRQNTVNQRVQYYENLNRESQNRQPIPARPYRPLYQRPSYGSQPSQTQWGQEDVLQSPVEQQASQVAPDRTQWNQINDLNKPSQYTLGQKPFDTRTDQVLPGKLWSQVEDLNEPSANLNQGPGQSYDLTQQVETVRAPWSQVNDLNQGSVGQKPYDITPNTNLVQQNDLDKLRQEQAQLYTNQQSQDLTRGIPEVSPQDSNPDYLNQQNQDLTQQTEDLTQDQQNEDFTQQTQNLLQNEKLEDLTQQHQDLTQPGQDSQDLNQQTEDLTQQYQDLTQQSQQSEDLTQQIENLTQQSQRNEDLVQQTEDLTQQAQQSDDLTQDTEYLTQQTQDLIQHEKLTHQDNDLNLHSQESQDLTQQTQDLTQQYQDFTHPGQQYEYITQQYQLVNQQNPFQQAQDLTQQSQQKDFTQQYQDLTQQFEDLTQQSQDLTHQNQDLTQQTEDLTHQDKQSQDLTQQTEDLTQQYQDLTHQGQQSQDLTQQTEDLTQQYQDLTHQGQQSQDFTQQTEDLTQQYQDLTHQGQQSQDLTQQTEDLTQYQDLTHQGQQIQGLTQQTEDLTQHYHDLTHPDQQSQDLSQQTEDLTKQNQDITQQSQQTEDLTQQTQDSFQNENLPSRPNRNNNDREKLTDAQRESQRLIDLLRQNQQTRYNNPNQIHYSPQPAYGYHDGRPVQGDTTRYGSNPQGRRAPYNQYAQVDEIPETQTVQQTESVEPETVKPQYSYVQQPKTEIVGEFEAEPVAPQVADEVQSVSDPTVPPEAEEVPSTTPKPGFWKRLGTRIKNKIG